MAANSSDIILHNCPQPPVAEKVRTVSGIKGLSRHEGIDYAGYGKPVSKW